MTAEDLSPVAARRRTLGAYLYAYTRTVELSCAWTMVVRDLPFKVALGRSIGYYGLGLQMLSRRVGQMYATGSKPAAPARYAAWLDAQAELRDERAIAAFLLGVQQDLARSMDGYLAQVHAGDEPTRLLLEALLLDLQRARAAMTPFTDGPAPVERVDSDDAVVEYTGKEALPALPDQPARPASVTHDPAVAESRGLPLEEAMQPKNLGAFFRRMYIEIEIAAIEVCARNIIEYRDMPAAFKVDMTSQIWDEARHAELAVALVRHFGLDLEGLSYSGMVWERHRLGGDLAERLAIEQCIQEGNSADRAYTMCPILRKFGHHEAAEALEWITADETQHAAIGNRWLLRLCDQSPERYDAVMKSANEKIKFPLSRPNRQLREIGGYPSWYVERLVRDFTTTQKSKR